MERYLLMHKAINQLLRQAGADPKAKQAMIYSVLFIVSKKNDNW